MFDKLNVFVYNRSIKAIEEGVAVKISEQIKVLCVRSNISMAELARRIGTTPQSLSGKMKRESFTVSDLDVIAEAVGAKFVRKFELYNGEEV